MEYMSGEYEENTKIHQKSIKIQEKWDINAFKELMQKELISLQFDPLKSLFYLFSDFCQQYEKAMEETLINNERMFAIQKKAMEDAINAMKKEMQDNNTNLTEKINVLNEKIQKVENVNELKTKEMNALNEKLQIQEESLKNVEKTLKDHVVANKEEKEKLQANLNEMNDLLNATQNEGKEMKAKQEELQGEIENLKKELAENVKNSDQNQAPEKEHVADAPISSASENATTSNDTLLENKVKDIIKEALLSNDDNMKIETINEKISNLKESLNEYAKKEELQSLEDALMSLLNTKENERLAAEEEYAKKINNKTTEAKVNKEITAQNIDTIPQNNTVNSLKREASDKELFQVYKILEDKIKSLREEFLKEFALKNDLNSTSKTLNLRIEELLHKLNTPNPQHTTTALSKGGSANSINTMTSTTSTNINIQESDLIPIQAALESHDKELQRLAKLYSMPLVSPNQTLPPSNATNNNSVIVNFKATPGENLPTEPLLLPFSTLPFENLEYLRNRLSRAFSMQRTISKTNDEWKEQLQQITRTLGISKPFHEGLTEVLQFKRKFIHVLPRLVELSLIPEQLVALLKTYEDSTKLSNKDPPFFKKETESLRSSIQSLEKGNESVLVVMDNAMEQADFILCRLFDYLAANIGEQPPKSGAGTTDRNITSNPVLNTSGINLYTTAGNITARTERRDSKKNLMDGDTSTNANNIKDFNISFSRLPNDDLKQAMKEMHNQMIQQNNKIKSFENLANNLEKTAEKLTGDMKKTNMICDDIYKDLARLTTKEKQNSAVILPSIGKETRKPETNTNSGANNKEDEEISNRNQGISGPAENFKNSHALSPNKSSHSMMSPLIKKLRWSSKDLDSNGIISDGDLASIVSQYCQPILDELREMNHQELAKLHKAMNDLVAKKIQQTFDAMEHDHSHEDGGMLDDQGTRVGRTNPLICIACDRPTRRMRKPPNLIWPLFGQEFYKDKESNLSQEEKLKRWKRLLQESAMQKDPNIYDHIHGGGYFVPGTGVEKNMPNTLTASSHNAPRTPKGDKKLIKRPYTTTPATSNIEGTKEDGRQE